MEKAKEMVRMFIGREEELALLEAESRAPKASLIALRGRRRIGKSRLIDQFSKSFSSRYMFTGLPPTKGITAKSQRAEFISQMTKQGLPAVKDDDWSDLFWVLGQAAQKGKILIALDEAAWMGSKDPTFLGKLKIAWDLYFEKNKNLTLVVTSSVSSWLDKNILKSTGFFGRVDLTLTLKELPFKNCCEFWGKHSNRVSGYEKFKVLSVTGGVPKYLQAIRPNLSAEQNIKMLCFTPEGLLYNEFDRIFHDLFQKRSQIYKNIVGALAARASLTQLEICHKIKRKNGRAISDYLADLTSAGFLESHTSWNIQEKHFNRLKHYRISDNYLRFYLKYIEPNKQQIEKGHFKNLPLDCALHWDTIMGFQFENLITHNHHSLYKRIGIEPAAIAVEGPYIQTQTKKREGCQIDYLIQTRTNQLFICEIKFSTKTLHRKVIDEVQEKINRLMIPKHFSYQPVLIHVGDVSSEVEKSGYFHSIIDATEMLSANSV